MEARRLWVAIAVSVVALLFLVPVLSAGRSDATGSKARFKLRSTTKNLPLAKASDVAAAYNWVAGVPKPANSSGISIGPAEIINEIIERVKQLPNSKQFAECRRDQDVPPVPASGRYLIAVNLHNSQDLMPHFIGQLLALVASAAPDNFFISIYESGDDETAGWLKLLRHLLDRIGVQNAITTTGITREGDQDRIAFLADMRNRALEPMFPPAKGSGTGWPADRVIFINDVFFCVDDVRRLLSHPGDIVCGMDFAHFMYDANEKYPAGKLHPFGPHGPYLSDGQDEGDEHFTFYDMWVARDANGQPFSNHRPFVSHLYSLERIKKGLPFPVTCCWNGLVVLDAEPFKQGVRFRAHDNDECKASECSLMCEDFQRAGHSHMIVDPGVRQAYTVEDAAELFGDKVSFIPPVSYAQMRAADPINYEYVPQKTLIMCCDKIEDSDNADWESCHPVDIYQLPSQVNYSKPLQHHHHPLASRDE